MIHDKMNAHFLFIYSTTDHITSSVRLEELIEEKKKLNFSKSISVLKFPDSQHVSHYLKYKQ